MIQPLSVLLTSSTPDLVSILLLVAILLISLKILDYARRIIMFWVWFVVKSVLWTAVIVFAWGVWRVGWEGVLKEVGWAWGLIGGFLDEGTGSGRNGAAGAAGGSAPDWGRRYNYRPGY